MRYKGLAFGLALALASPSFAITLENDTAAPEMRAAPNHIVREAGTGCMVGASTGAVLSVIGTLGLGIIPATTLGCGFGAVAGPFAADFYDRHRVDLDTAITSVQQWWDSHTPAAIIK